MAGRVAPSDAKSRRSSGPPAVARARAPLSGARGLAPVGPLEGIALAAIVLLVAAVGVRACFGPEERLAFLFYDDAYYYLGVARSLAAGMGSTFDGINPTNGYHPLWCGLLVPIFTIVRDPGSALRAAGALWFALAALAPIALWRTLRPRTGAAGAVAAAALFALQPWVGLGLGRPNGLETPLYALMIALFLAAFEGATGGAGARPALRRVFGLGLLLGLVMLARLDAGLLALAAAVLIAGRASRAGARAAFADAALLAVGAALVVIPFLAWSQSRFGHPMPVSGRVVSLQAARERASLGGPASAAFARRRAYYATKEIPGTLLHAALRGAPGEGSLARGDGAAQAALLGAIVLVAGALLVRRRSGPTASDALALLALFALLHYATYALWLWTAGEEEYRRYYFMPEWMLVAAAAGALAGPLLERAVRVRALGMLLGAAVIGALGWHLYQQSDAQIARLQSEEGRVADRHIYGWVKRTLPSDAVLGARDAGKLGYFSGHPVVNLDGLINDQRLFDAIRDHREDAYIAASPIRYLLFDRPWLGGFEASRPSASLPKPTELGEMLGRLARRPGFALKETGDPPPDWVVLEIQRH